MKKIRESAKHAIFIGSLCSVSYLAVYFAKNVLSAVTPHMIESGFTKEYIGQISSLYFIFYAVGQIINGAVGDRIKARYMISFGLLLAGVSNLVFSQVTADPTAAMIAYGMTGFFLSMIYGPLTKVVAENTDPLYTTRCSLGYTLASFLGTPIAGIVAVFLSWQSVFIASTVTLAVMAVACFSVFLLFEKKGIVKYGQFKRAKESGGTEGIKVLIKRRIIQFALIAMLTGVVRTVVVMWMPTYFLEALKFSPANASAIFSVATFCISFTTFISVFTYERLKRNMDLTMLVMFSSSTVLFTLVYFVKHPILNIIFLVLGVMASNGAATMLWSRYCPSLRDTGMVSSATGFLDALSYLASAAASPLFANAADAIGWENMILIWIGLVVLGALIIFPYRKVISRLSKKSS